MNPAQNRILGVSSVSLKFTEFCETLLPKLGQFEFYRISRNFFQFYETFRSLPTFATALIQFDLIFQYLTAPFLTVFVGVKGYAL